MARAAARRLLVVARSARALAQAAQAAGMAPLVVDQFGDADTRAAATRLRVVRPARDYAFRFHETLTALATLAAGRCLPLIWGGGCEGEAALLKMLSHRYEVLGTPLAALAAIAAPAERRARVRGCGLATPAIAFERVPVRGRWLAKRAAQSGGLHVRLASAGSALAAGEYAQRYVAGRSLSIAFVAARHRVQVLGYSAHLFATSPYPFAHAGAVGGVHVPPTVDRDLRRALPALVAAFDLRGLVGLDFVLDAAGKAWVVDVNPRPTATVELLAVPASALRAHLAACRDEDWMDVTPRRRPRALAVLFVNDPIRVAKSLDWPAWVADRPGAGARLPRGAPLCSVWADGTSTDEALGRLDRRVLRLKRLLGSDALALPAVRQPGQR